MLLMLRLGCISFRAEPDDARVSGEHNFAAFGAAPAEAQTFQVSLCCAVIAT